ncbi:MAG: 2-oxoglutarate dehydrogenase E1 component [Sulfuricella sp.]|jgi:2-oxoglutarate dehydrogenase E1 component|nr:2-oxoglutarate dehydrogenase E1 component [Sulfuricella sp.]
MNKMQAFLDNSYLYGGNAEFIEGLYESWLGNPASVGEEWQGYFERLQQGAGAAPRDIAHAPIRASFIQRARQSGAINPAAVCSPYLLQARKQVRVLQLINAYRFLGVRHANVDPIKRFERPFIPELELEYYGLTEADLTTVFDTGSLVGLDKAPLAEILAMLQETYCGTFGAEYMYISDTAQKRWLQARIEGCRARPNLPAAQKKHVLGRITAAETLEKYLHARFVGQKRFSLEGGESLIPLLDHLVELSGAAGVQEVVLGMAHRGRLNVLVNIIGKMPRDLFKEFEGIHSHHDHITTGDVKYHQGFSSDVATSGGPVHVTLAFNPSHLEIINPVVEGSVRARQHRRNDHLGEQVMPVLIHGDAAFAGQGVVMETLNMSQTRGFGTGGTVHVVVNNQIGFTTSDARDTRSSLYCTDVAKMVEAPVFHVNGDDPEAVLLAVQIAFDYRMTYKKDVVIDMVCLRRLGHNEQDEPAVTQPLMYKKIAQHPGTRQIYAARLAAEGVVTPDEAQRMIANHTATLDAGEQLRCKPVLSNFKRAFATDWKKFTNANWNQSAHTAVPRQDLQRLAEKLTTVPDDFKLHPRVEKILADRRLMGAGKLPLDWGMAENLAYAALLENGYGVRISGQDSGRGTFFHRHAVLHDQKREKWDAGEYVPLQHIADKQPHFMVIDSLLSEAAVLGFEYGYATAEPEQLVIWEAQFGDFANGAQVVIDQFICAGETKWGRLCGLVLMLPHGYEGQGPEHSSARLERYLQLCAEYNMQVCVPSTPAQMFHLLRRQMLRPYRKPLIIMSPKSMLRHKASVSSLDDLASGAFQPLIPEPEKLDSSAVRRVIACCGKVYYDLVAARHERDIKDIAILRVEQLYPFPHDEFAAEMRRYAKVREVMWVQEEPKNQGAWYAIEHYLRQHMKADQTLSHSSRKSSAAPAVGYMVEHLEQQKALVDKALG